MGKRGLFQRISMAEQVPAPPLPVDVPPPPGPAAVPLPGEDPVLDVKDKAPSKTESDLTRALAFTHHQVSSLPRMAGSNQPTLQLAKWWYDQIGGEAGLGVGSARYIGFAGYHGISANVYNYTGLAGQAIVPCAQLGDWYWRAQESGTLTSTRYTYSDEVSGRVANPTASDHSLMTHIVRLRTYTVDGQAAVLWARALASSLAAPGAPSSSVAPVARLVGYLHAMMVPADPGGSVPASIPADSPLSVDAGWFPYHPGTGEGLPAIPAIFVTSEVCVRWLVSERTIPGFDPADIGRSLLLVPVDHAGLVCPASIAWMAAGMMEYPVRRIGRRGVMRDSNGNLFDLGAAADFVNTWYSSVMLMRVDGVGGTAAGAIKVMFVYARGAGGLQGEAALHLPGLGEAGLNLAAGAANPVEVDFGPVLQALFGDISSQMEAVYDATMRLLGLTGDQGALATALLFWQEHGLMWPRPWECWDIYPDGMSTSGRMPQHSSVRGFVPAAAAARFTPETAGGWQNFMVNSALMLPGLQFRAGVGAEGVPTAVHFHLPHYSPVLGLACAAGIVQPTAPAGTLENVSPMSLAAGIMRGGLNFAAVYDLFAVYRYITRRCIVSAGRGPEPAVEKVRIRGMWGNAGPIPAGRGLSLAGVGYLSISRKEIAPFWPCNGQYLRTVEGELTSGRHLFGRIATPVLKRYAESLPVSDVTYGTFGDFFGTGYIMGLDLETVVSAVPALAAVDDWVGAWKQAACFSGYDPETNPACPRFEVYHIAGPHFCSPMTLAIVPSVARYGPLAVGAHGQVCERYAYLDSASWLTIDRPPPSLDTRALSLTGICNGNRAMARSRHCRSYIRWDFGANPVTFADPEGSAAGMNVHERMADNPF
uniref:Uncharacterized protein n=1 Tax=Jiamusi Totiv tick virus 1 TaxID=2972346 RepID=A0A9E7V2F9_9VIRU|nr:MAG: hypothetical protein [Jiamusi Totiv tick virus 1]WAK77366.1 MAG: hypothetical protein [Totiviridae sp.]